MFKITPCQMHVNEVIAMQNKNEEAILKLC